jgi:hypothetical protein
MAGTSDEIAEIIDEIRSNIPEKTQELIQMLYDMLEHNFHSIRYEIRRLCENPELTNMLIVRTNVLRKKTIDYCKKMSINMYSCFKKAMNVKEKDIEKRNQMLANFDDEIDAVNKMYDIEEPDNMPDIQYEIMKHLFHKMSKADKPPVEGMNQFFQNENFTTDNRFLKEALALIKPKLEHVLTLLHNINLLVNERKYVMLPTKDETDDYIRHITDTLIEIRKITS